MLPLDFWMLENICLGVSATMIGPITTGFIDFVFDLEAPISSRSNCIKLIILRFVFIESVVVSQHL